MAAKLYSLSLVLYGLGIRLVSLVNPKAKKFVKGRKDLSSKLSKRLKQKKRIWLHCASVGEFEQAIPLWQKLKKAYPNHQFVFSFFSPSGYEYALTHFPELAITYMPIDQLKKAKEFVKILNPELAIFIKYEFWHNHLRALSEGNIPTILVSGIFRKNQFFFKPFGAFFRKSLSYFTHFFVQNEESLKLLNTINLNNVSLSGDTRYERVLDNKATRFSDKKIENFIAGHSNILVCGSIWASDLVALKNIENHLNKDWKIILVPHEPDHFNYSSSRGFSKYSEPINNAHQTLLVDKMGVLSKLYRYATVAYIGGGFGKGIHNILEAAIYKIPVLIGPNYDKFQEAKDLIELEQVIAIKADNSAEMLQKAIKTTPIILENAYSFMTQNTNATEHILVFIKKHSIL